MSEHEHFPPGWSRATEIPHIKVLHHHGEAHNPDHAELAYDWMPDYAAVVTRSVTLPKWSQNFLLPTGSQVLSPNDVILVPPAFEVEYDMMSFLPFKALAIKGTVTFSPRRATQLMVGTIQVYPGGKLIIKSQVQGSATIIFKGPLEWDKDPEQFSLGLFTTGGTVEIEGMPKKSFSYARSARGGSSIVFMDSTEGWRQGDTVLFADTQKGVDVSHWTFAQGARFLPQQFERRKVIGRDVDAIRLDKPVTYDHTGGFVVNESRSITFRIDKGNSKRAHVLFGGHTQVSVKNACFYDLGRTKTDMVNSAYRNDEGDLTENHFYEYAPPPEVGSEVFFEHNQIGRYPLHAHHVHEGVLFEGNVVTGSIIKGDRDYSTVLGAPRWGIVLHGSHGLIRNNAVVGAQGAGIVAEGGTETGLVEGNLVVGTGGGALANTPHVANYFEEVPALHFKALVGPAAWGETNSGVGYWFRGPFVAVRHNATAGYFQSGAFEVWTHGKTVKIPPIPRVHEDGSLVLGLPDDGLAGTDQRTNYFPLDFYNNLSDSISQNELNISYVNYPSLVRSFRATHRGNGSCVRMGWSSHIIFAQLRITGEGLGTGVNCNDDTKRFDLHDCRIEGFARAYREDRLGELIVSEPEI